MKQRLTVCSLIWLVNSDVGEVDDVENRRSHNDTKINEKKKKKQNENVGDDGAVLELFLPVWPRYVMACEVG